MATDFDAIALDCFAAFGANAFSWSSGEFYRYATHDVDSMGWAWEFRHRWAVSAAAGTRDALVRRGLIEALPSHVGGERFRVALSVMHTEGASNCDKRHATPSFKSYLEARAKAEAEKAASPHSRTVARW